MKRVIFVLTGLIFASQAFAQSDEFDCQDLDNLPQAGLNFCADLDFEAADTKLNEVWLAVRDKVRAAEEESEDFTGWFDMILAGQRSWLTYRDNQCEAEGFAFSGGSMQAMVVAGCKSRLTQARTEDLESLLEEN